jgi:hypothetical protein
LEVTQARVFSSPKQALSQRRRGPQTSPDTIGSGRLCNGAYKEFSRECSVAEPVAAVISLSPNEDAPPAWKRAGGRCSDAGGGWNKMVTSAIVDLSMASRDPRPFEAIACCLRKRTAACREPLTETSLSR